MFVMLKTNGLVVPYIMEFNPLHRPNDCCMGALRLGEPARNNEQQVSAQECSGLIICDLTGSFKCVTKSLRSNGLHDTMRHGDQRVKTMALLNSRHQRFASDSVTG